jgi:4a-hydroxytetrahydrobiopterin dehydratase
MCADAEELNQQEIDDALAELSGWSLEDGMLHKTFEFEDFSEAVGWMMRVALEAEKMDHHPDWCNSWNKVHVHLLTHSIEALSQYDVELAQKMEELART